MADVKIPAEEIIVVPTGRLHPNPWNPNKVDERTRQAVEESLDLYGFVDPLTVRPHPDKPGEYEIIDGEHRWEIGQEKGYTQMPVIELDLSDAQAKRLTIVLNETRGEADQVDLASLLADLKLELGDEFRVGLRYDDTTLDYLLKMADEDWQSRYDPSGPDGQQASDGDWHTLTFRIPIELLPNWQAAREQVASREDLELHDEEQVANGQALEVLVASYLAAA